MIEVRSPVEDFTGVTAGVVFDAGRAEVDHLTPSQVAYFRKAGYTITRHAPASAAPAPPAPAPAPAAPVVAEATVDVAPAKKAPARKAPAKKKPAARKAPARKRGQA